MNSRDKILGSLRKANTDIPKSLPLKIEDKDLFKDYPEDILKSFIEHFEALAGVVYVVKSYEEAARRLLSMINVKSEKPCLIQTAPLCLRLMEHRSELKSYLAYDDDLRISSSDFAMYEVGVTIADYLVARTGSIVLNANDMGGRRLSVLPPIHVVLAFRNQIVPSLEDVFRGYASDKKDWSYATIITGASRTADIEKILVLGAHGPKRLVCILIDQ